MSDSDTSPLPSEEAIAKALQNVVLSLHKAGDTENLTIKRVRARAEKSLGLPANFFKADQFWKQKSDKVIKEAVEKYCGDEAEPEPPASATPQKPAKKEIKAKSVADGPRGQKRKAAAPPKKPQKRAKAVESSDEDSEEAQSPAHKRSNGPSRSAGRARKTVVEEDSDEEDGIGAPQELSQKVENTEDAVQDHSESELSSLIDESPVKKKRASTEKRAPASKAKAAPKAKARSTSLPADPEEAEIKRLQGWLVKCGVRKVWSKELARYDTPREKIKHLKQMLKDVGMEGKYSVEKAARIKEERELAKELEAVQEGERSWGNADAGEGGRPRRRAARAAAKVVVPKFDDDDEDEEEGSPEEADAEESSDAAQESSAEDGGDTSEEDEADDSE